MKLVSINVRVFLYLFYFQVQLIQFIIMNRHHEMFISFVETEDLDWSYIPQTFLPLVGTGERWPIRHELASRDLHPPGELWLV